MACASSSLQPFRTILYTPGSLRSMMVDPEVPAFNSPPS